LTKPPLLVGHDKQRVEPGHGPGDCLQLADQALRRAAVRKVLGEEDHSGDPALADRLAQLPRHAGAAEAHHDPLPGELGDA
jgi:hypothetical protein